MVDQTIESTVTTADGKKLLFAATTAPIAPDAVPMPCRHSRCNSHHCRPSSHHHHRHRSHHCRQSSHHHIPHHCRSINSRIGLSPSPSSTSTSPYISDELDKDEQLPPSACGQPIPAQILRKIHRGEFVNFSSLLPQAVNLDQVTRDNQTDNCRHAGTTTDTTRQPNHPRLTITDFNLWMKAWTHLSSRHQFLLP